MNIIAMQHADRPFQVFRAEPVGSPKGALVLIHEIWGLVEHIADIAGRFADEGYLVLAPDLLSSAGTTPEVGQELSALMADGDEQVRNAAQPRLRAAFAPTRSPEYAAWAVPALRRVVDELATDSRVADRIAVAGFCFGGTYSFALAAADNRIRAAVPFYGAPPDLDDVAAIGCPVLAFYGDQDSRLMDSLPGVRQAMSDAGVAFTAEVYPDVGHAFFNDTNRSAYGAAASADAWRRTVDFLDRSLTPGAL